MESVEEIANGKSPTINIPNLCKQSDPSTTTNSGNTIKINTAEVLKHKKAPYKFLKEEHKLNNTKLDLEYCISLYIYRRRSQRLSGKKRKNYLDVENNFREVDAPHMSKEEPSQEESDSEQELKNDKIEHHYSTRRMKSKINIYYVTVANYKKMLKKDVGMEIKLGLKQEKNRFAMRTKKNIDATDLLVNLHNSLVYVLYKRDIYII